MAVVRRARVAVAGPEAGVLVAIIEAPELVLRPDQAMAASRFRRTAQTPNPRIESRPRVRVMLNRNRSVAVVSRVEDTMPAILNFHRQAAE